MQERLQKFLASAGVASRRKAEALIVAGRISVNGRRVTKLGSTIDPMRDQVAVDGQAVAKTAAFRTLALNKPAGVVCSKLAQGKERTVYDLVPRSRDLAIAGRLDKDSEGLVLLSNDGDLVNRLTHPRYQHAKEYVVMTIRPLDAAALNRLRRGIRLTEGRATVDAIEPLSPTRYRIVLHQGWKRQLRRMLAAIGHDVRRLTRVRLGRLTLGDLRPGAWREVERRDVL